MPVHTIGPDGGHDAELRKSGCPGPGYRDRFNSEFAARQRMRDLGSASGCCNIRYTGDSNGMSTVTSPRNHKDNCNRRQKNNHGHND